MGKRNKRSGANAERELAKVLRDQYGFDQVRRGLSFRHEPDLIGLLSIHIECKMWDKIELTRWINQAIAAADKYHDGLPAVFHRRIREPWFVSMLQDDFDTMNPVDVLLKPCTGKCNPVEDMDQKYDGMVYFRKVGTIVTLPLQEWVGVYWEWKLPFTED